MSSLTIRNIPDQLHQKLKIRAQQHHRSLNGEVLAILDEAIINGSVDAAEPLGNFLLQSPLSGSGLRLERDADTGREVDL